MADIQEFELQINMALMAVNRELRTRLAAELWRNRQLARENRRLEEARQHHLSRYTKAHTRNGELSAQVRDLQAALRVTQGHLADVNDIKQKLAMWEGD